MNTETYTLKQVISSGLSLESVSDDNLYKLYKDTDVTPVIFLTIQDEITKRLSSSPTKLNIIFGVLESGEIFVEVGGEQYTPASGFYKLASIQSAKLAHQVRDLQLEIFKLNSNTALKVFSCGSLKL